jgi:hypothetical protein
MKYNRKRSLANAPPTPACRSHDNGRCSRLSSRCCRRRPYCIWATLAIFIFTNVAMLFCHSNQIIIVSAQEYGYEYEYEQSESQSQSSRRRSRAYRNEQRSAERDERREERKKRRYQQREEAYSSSYSSSSYHKDGEANEDDEPDMEAAKQLYDLYKAFSPGQSNPRNVFQGTFKGLKCALFGVLSGLPFFFGLPVILYRTDGLSGWLGLVLGLIAGTISSAILAGIGFINGAYQLLIGLWNTPSAASSYFFKSKLWNPIDNAWETYDLDEESERLLNSSVMFNKDVSNTLFYDLLDVKPGATSKEIKRGYYSKAKDLHPDKNPNNEEAAELFIKVHEAYETLIDPDARKEYDTIGKSSSSSASGMTFNVGVFFEILFASQPVEPYVGQLSVSSFFGQIVKLVQANSGPEPLSLETISSVLLSSQTQKLQRPVQVALHLREFIQPLVSQEMNEKEFKMLCEAEAEKIAENSFGETFLLHIGNALLEESNLYLSQSWYGWPLWMFSITKKKSRNLKVKVSGIKMMIQFISALFNDDDDDGMERQENDKEKKSRFNVNVKTNVSGKMIEEMLPQILEMAWAYNAQDIAQLLEQACEKVLFNSKVQNSGERKRQAKALRMLGRTFVERSHDAYSAKQCSEEDGTCKSPETDAVEMKARLDVAYKTAMQQTRQSNSESEEMIKKTKAQFQ